MRIIETDPNKPDAILLMDELSNILESITGRNGRNSFDPNDVCVPRALFVIAYDENNQAVGCGGFRPKNENIAEIKTGLFSGEIARISLYSFLGASDSKLISPSAAGFNFHKGNKRFVLPDSFSPNNALTRSRSIHPLS